MCILDHLDAVEIDQSKKVKMMENQHFQLRDVECSS